MTAATTAIKSYSISIDTHDDGVGMPSVAQFGIDLAYAKQLLSLHRVVKEHGLYRAEKFDHLPDFYVTDPKRLAEILAESQDDADDKEALEDENLVSTDNCTLTVSATEFWFTANMRHGNEEFQSTAQPLQELFDHFGLQA